MRIRASAVIKLGGSLLGLPDLAARLGNFLSDFSRPRPILICGGGPLVDFARKWDRIYSIGDEESHWIALRILSITSSIVARILPDRLTLVDSPEGCVSAWNGGRVPVYDPFHYIVDIDEVSSDSLPRRWRVTSDSIAAKMAVHFAAPELVLLKSVTLPERMTLADAAADGVVDYHFPLIARDIPRVVSFNLRAENPEERILYDPDGGLRHPGDPAHAEGPP